MKLNKEELGLIKYSLESTLDASIQALKWMLDDEDGKEVKEDIKRLEELLKKF